MKRKISLITFSLVVFLSFVSLSYQQIPKTCSGVPNFNPIITSPPTFVNKTTNGELWIYNQVNPPLRHLIVKGSPYEMGYAAGQLLAPILPELIKATEDWLANDLPSFFHTLPAYIQRIIIEVGMDAALGATIELTYPYTPTHFIAEIQGLADGSGVSYYRLYQVNVIPELIQAACSMVGLFPPARQSLLHLRALDWQTSGPFQRWPLLTSYVPSAHNSNNFSILGWPGFIGALTGFSSMPMSISEKVWLGYNGTQNRVGIPWHFLLRDILQFDKSISEAESRMANADRTCSIWVGVGEEKGFNIVAYSYERVLFYDWRAFPVYEAHPKIPGVMYLDRHPQPSNHKCMGDLMVYWNGGGRNMTVENTVKYVTAGEMTGDMHIAVMDYAKKTMTISNAGIYNPSTKQAQPAYQRSFVQVDLSWMFQK